MKTLLYSIVGLLLMVGCAPNAQLITLRGNNVTPSSEGLVLNNDSLTLRYSFYSERGLMELTLFNKLSVPLYVDWKKSAFIVGKNKLDYWYDVADVNLAASSYRYYRSASTSISGTISKEDQVSFIPPKTELVKRQFVVFPGGNLPLAGQPVVTQEPSKDPYGNPKKPVSVEAYQFTAQQSPLAFRNFLTLSTQRDFLKEFYIDTNFWAETVKVLPVTQLPNRTLYTGEAALQEHTQKASDAFYVILKPSDNSLAN